MSLPPFEMTHPPSRPGLGKRLLLFTILCGFLFPALFCWQSVGASAGPKRVQVSITSPEQKKTEIRQWIRQLAFTEFDKRRVAENRLGDFGAEAFSLMLDALKDPNPMIRSGIVETFVKMIPSQIEPILEMFTQEKTLMVKVAYYTLFANGFPNNLDVQNAIIQATYHKDEKSRAEAAGALGHMRADRAAALKRLLAMLNDPSETEYVINYLVRALKDLGHEGALDSLEALVDPGVIGTGPFQRGVISAIGRIGTPRGVKILIKCLNHPRSELITDAVNVLISMNFISVKELVPALEDPNTPPAIKANVAWVLGAMGEFLKDIKGSKNEELSSYVGRAIRALEKAAQDNNWSVKSRAEEALTNLERAGARLKTETNLL